MKIIFFNNENYTYGTFMVDSSDIFEPSVRLKNHLVCYREDKIIEIDSEKEFSNFFYFSSKAQLLDFICKYKIQLETQIFRLEDIINKITKEDF